MIRLAGTPEQIGIDRWEDLERSMRAEKERLKDEVAASAAAARAAGLVEQWSATQAEKLLAALGEPE